MRNMIVVLIGSLFALSAARGDSCTPQQSSRCDLMCMGIGDSANCSVDVSYACWDSGPGHIQCGTVKLVTCVCASIDPGGGNGNPGDFNIGEQIGGTFGMGTPVLVGTMQCREIEEGAEMCDEFQIEP